LGLSEHTIQLQICSWRALSFPIFEIVSLNLGIDQTPFLSFSLIS
jgi:hypothetical protein